MLAEFAAGKVQVVCNCGVLTEGFDDPGVEVVIMGRPTKSRSLYSQMVGRSTRPLPGVVDGPETAEARKAAIAASAKPSCLVVDFRRQRRQAQADHQRGHPGREGERRGAGTGREAGQRGGRPGEHDRGAGRSRSRAARAEAAGGGRAAGGAGGEGAVHDAVRGPVRRAAARAR